jgi:Protein of unknown function, DUF547
MMKKSNFVMLALSLTCTLGFAQKNNKHKNCTPSKSTIMTSASQKKETISKISEPTSSKLATNDNTIAVVETVKSASEITTQSEPVITAKNVEEPTKITVLATENPKPQQATANLHDAFDVILKKYVSTSGKVNYKDLKENKADLEAYTKALSDNPPAEKAPKAERFAYWINAYNAFTLKMIADNYPLSSVTKLDGGKPWDVKRITIGGKKYSLNDIENNVLRPMGDARIHFAINCAAKSCPPIHNVAFTAANLNSVLESRAKRFINDTKANSLKDSELKISKIFDWYGKDFDKIPEFINRFAITKVKTDAKIGFMEYDWSLNE